MTAPVCIDLSRSVARAPRVVRTGIDRVERAYLDHLLSDPQRQVLGLVRVRGGHVILDRTSLLALKTRFDQGPPHRRGDRARSLTWWLLRRGVVPRPLLARRLRALLPPGGWYVNVGHSNLGPRVLTAFAAAGWRSAVMLHDMIPLTHPRFQRSGIPERFEAMARRVALTADLVIANSRQTAGHVRKGFAGFGRIPPICIAPLGVDRPHPETCADLPGLGSDRPVFTCLGTIEPRKNHGLLLDVWERMLATRPEADMPLLAIAGHRGWADRALFRRLDRLKATGLVREFNDLSDMQVARLLLRSAALLFPSHAEGFGLPAAEAATLGVPVVCTPLPVFREILGEYPMVVAADDPVGWTTTIRQHARAWQSDGGLRRLPAAMPTWTDHFNIVLSRLC